MPPRRTWTRVRMAPPLKVWKDGRLTIPASVRKELGLVPGDRVVLVRNAAGRLEPRLPDDEGARKGTRTRRKPGKGYK